MATTAVSFTTIVRKAQHLGAITTSDQHGGIPILVCAFGKKNKADEMRDYVTEKGWDITGDVKEKGQYVLTITAPSEVDYRSLLQRYIALVKEQTGSDCIPDEHANFSAEEIDALDELS